jgi:hypothetical protein
VWTGSVWLRIDSIGGCSAVNYDYDADDGCSEHDYEPLASIKGRDLLD